MGKSKFKLKQPTGKPYSSVEADHDRVDVGEILKDNRDKQLENEAFTVTDHPRRKRRDYLVLMVAVNLLLVLPMVFVPNLLVVVSCLAGMVLFSVAISWVMWGVMGEY